MPRPDWSLMGGRARPAGPGTANQSNNDVMTLQESDWLVGRALSSYDWFHEGAIRLVEATTNPGNMTSQVITMESD